MVLDTLSKLLATNCDQDGESFEAQIRSPNGAMQQAVPPAMQRAAPPWVRRL